LRARLAKKNARRQKNNKDPDEKSASLIDGLALLVAWCDKKKISVSFEHDSNGIYDFNTRSVKINSRAGLTTQLFFLAHECGHVLVGAREPEQKFGMGYSHDDRGGSPHQHSMKYKCDVVAEEIEAWWRGKKLMDRLGVQYDSKKLDKLRVECIMSYFRCYGARKLKKRVLQMATAAELGSCGSSHKLL